MLFSHKSIIVDRKKIWTWELWVKFYLGQNEDYSPGDSLSDSSEEVLWRGRGKVGVIYDFSEGAMSSYTHILHSHEEQMSPLMILVLFQDVRRCKKLSSYSLLKISNYLKAYSASFSQSTECLLPDLHPELLSGCVEGQRLQWLVT